MANATEDDTIEINGMAHVILTVSQWDKAHAFYSELLPFLGLTKVYDGNNFLYHVGSRTAEDCGAVMRTREKAVADFIELLNQFRWTIHD